MKEFKDLAAFTPKRIRKVRNFDSDAIFKIKGLEGGAFAIASSKKELKQLQKSDADVVYFEEKGKLYLNQNGEKKGWGAKKVGGLLAKFKGKPQLNATNFRGIASYLGDPDNSLDDEIQVDSSLDDEIQVDKTLGRTAPVFNSMLPGTRFQVESDIKQDFVDGLTGRTNSVKYELGDNQIIKAEQNNNINPSVYNMTIYKGEFSYDGLMLANTKIDEMISASVSSAFEDYRYWSFSEPIAFDLQRALSSAGMVGFPAPTSTDKDYVTQKSEGLFDGNWYENLFEKNRIV